MQKEPFPDAKGGSFFVCRKFYNWYLLTYWIYNNNKKHKEKGRENMGMSKKEMVPGRKCYVQVHSVDGGLTPIKSAKATILAKPIFSTVLVELDTPLKERMDVPVDCVYWTKQD